MLYGNSLPPHDVVLYFEDLVENYTSKSSLQCNKGSQISDFNMNLLGCSYQLVKQD